MSGLRQDKGQTLIGSIHWLGHLNSYLWVGINDGLRSPRDQKQKLKKSRRDRMRLICVLSQVLVETHETR